MMNSLRVRSRKTASVVLGLALFLAVALGVLGGKFRLIDRSGSDLPYWDQWDAEGDFLYRPFVNDTLHISDFVRPHNEHRIAPTLVWVLGLFILNDEQWDGRLEMAANAFLHTLVGLALLALAWRLVGKFAAIFLALPIVLLLTSPASWENTLSGFQSQFYFLILFSGLHLGMVLATRPRSLTWWLAPIAGILAVLSMGSGVLSSAAVIGALALKLLRDRKIIRDDVIMIVIHLGIFAWGRWLAVTVASTGGLKSHDFAQWMDAWLHQLSWPITAGGFAWCFPMGFLPPLLLVTHFLRTKENRPVSLFHLGASAWYIAQTMAIAYARGGVGYGYGPRYVDLLNVGLLLNLLTLVYLGSTAPKKFGRIFFGLATCALILFSVRGSRLEEARAEKSYVRDLTRYNLARAESVRSWVNTRDHDFFNKIPWKELPFPEPHYLSELLDRPEIRKILPPSVRPPPAFSWQLPPTPAFAIYRATDAPPSRSPFSLMAWELSGEVASTHESRAFVADHAVVSTFVSASGGATVSVFLRKENGEEIPPLGSPLSFATAWKRVNFSVNPGSYRLSVTKDGPGRVIVTQPVTDTRLSRWAARAVSSGEALEVWSVSFGVLVIALSWWTVPLPGRRSAPERGMSRR